MQLTITTTHRPATDLGYLLHKNPARLQSFDASFGRVHVFYPEATADRCTAVLLLDVDPIGLVRTGRGQEPSPFALEQYVNDRPYVASSFLSVAISDVFGTAKDHRFEWTRGEFEAWAGAVAARSGYAVRVAPIGPEDPDLVGRKLAGPEQSTLEDADIAFYQGEYERLRGMLEDAFQASALPDAPSDATKAALNDSLVRVRLQRVL